MSDRDNDRLTVGTLGARQRSTQCYLVLGVRVHRDAAFEGVLQLLRDQRDAGGTTDQDDRSEIARRYACRRRMSGCSAP